MPSHPSAAVYIALFGWVPLTILLFAFMPSRRAMLIGMVGAWLFLPVYAFKAKALPEFSKLTAATYGCLLGTLIFDWKLFSNFKFRWFDLPMLCFCLTPYVTSVENGLGWYDGISAVIQNTIIWGLPYFLGRIYFRDWSSFKDLGVAIVIGGLIYVPLCLIEIRISPQLHKMVYGFSQAEYTQSIRMGGYRPIVFLQHGLAVGMWMNSATLCAVWMWQSKTIKTLGFVPIIAWACLLILTTLLCKSLAGLAFLCAGIGILYSIKFTRLPILLLGVIAVAPTYMIVRLCSINAHSEEIVATIGQQHAMGEPIGEAAVALSLKLAGEERTQSFETRIRSENQLGAHAMEQPWFGWGRWNRNRVHDGKGKDVAPTDGLWMIALGVSGIVGLSAFTIAILLPPLMLWYRCPLKYWDHPGTAPAVAMAVLLSLYMCDNILNAMPDPVFTLALGGLAGIAPNIRRQVMAQQAAPRQANASSGMPAFAPRPAQAV